MNFKALALTLLLFSAQAKSQSDNNYYQIIKEEGKEPVSFVKDQLQQHNLIIFDDGLHAAVEPFEFYCNYLKNHPQSVNYVFLEVVPITAQKQIDDFLSNPVKDTMLLAGVFQQDLRYGWPYETYLDLFFTVWEINQTLPEEDKIEIIGVDQPVYWEGIHSREDYNLLQKSLVGRDYFMYKIITDKLNQFNSSKKGLFLTNTRHAYKCIKNSNGNIYWNTGTFFNQWHPGKTYSIRFHNMILEVKANKKNVKNASSEGLDKMVYNWVRMDNGKWDKAFEMNGNIPVAIALKGNRFGQFKYYGNHMADVYPGQTMFDAYDALVFLKPLEETKFSAHTNFYFTDAFKKELEHRVKVIHEHDLNDFLEKNGVSSVEEYIEQLSKYKPQTSNPLVN